MSTELTPTVVEAEAEPRLTWHPEAELAHVPANLFGTQNPAEVVARCSEIATALADVLKSKNLAKQIGNRSFVLVEGWTLLGTMLGVFPVVQWTRRAEDGWEARVEARTLNGQVVGSAEAECLRSENNWKTRDDYALRSMAQTRAVSKALRGPLGFIVTLAGYEATPADEIPEPSSDGDSDERNQARMAVKYAFKHALEHGSIPPGHKSWEEYVRWHIKGRYGADSSTDLTVEQLHELAEYLLDQDIPI